MYSVYKITNLINNKSYIGSSIRVEKRWQEHKNTAFNPNSSQYNYPLYRAFRKYGIENFKFEVICDDFNDANAMQQYEQEMIYYYDSYNNGYNQTYNTTKSTLGQENLRKYINIISKKCAKVDKNNQIIEIYNSYHDAARKNGYNEECASLIRRICKGEIRSSNNEIYRDIDQNGNICNVTYLTSSRRKKIYAINILTLEEFFYDSISEAARSCNIERARIQKCISGDQRYSIIHNLIFREIDENDNIVEIKNKPTIEEKIEEYNRTNPIINGERHTIKEWCEIYKISRTSYYNRLKTGMGVIEALTTPKRR